MPLLQSGWSHSVRGAGEPLEPRPDAKCRRDAAIVASQRISVLLAPPGTGDKSDIVSQAIVSPDSGKQAQVLASATLILLVSNTEFG